ncbi:ectonucleoside triphosphate diphosphohydrolase 5-like isoform X1 [Varroa jacobsoni]|uniref:ectonucleoside triphosphate diphosphohydrolase 5-like isoform X1 n=2 Tax=Varroa jacobsoni TaxID=62625 RepID=UPI000BF946C1|nr:ectonucleoside triphosphate diphosphohydrolase 5-like isoform X1 [Varroa jacobsoni]
MAQLRRRLAFTAPRLESKSCGYRHSSRCPSVRICLCVTACFICLILAATLVALYILDAFTHYRVKYSIMFDAGSTGSRMHIFQFQICSNNEIRLAGETYYTVSPGLSDYANNPHEAGMSLKPMLDKAKIAVPASEQRSTPLVLKATAGLRLLPNNAQNQILHEIQNTFSQYPFKSNNSSVSIMEGKDEGFYAWLMVVFTLGRKLRKNSIATLDLGGGSTQITFQPNDKTTLAKSEHLSYFKIPGGSEELMYVYSYLGGGLMYGRAEILKQNITRKNGTHFYVTSPCVHPEVAKLPGGLYWKYFEASFAIGPDDTDRCGFEACYLLAKKYVDRLNMFAPQELPSRELYLMSYYFYRAANADLIQKGVETQKDLAVSDYRERAISECASSSTRPKEDTFLCIDLTYIYALLHEGLKLPDNTKITVAQKLRGSEVSWAFGAALSELEL